MKYNQKLVKILLFLSVMSFHTACSKTESAGINNTTDEIIKEDNAMVGKGEESVEKVEDSQETRAEESTTEHSINEPGILLHQYDDIRAIMGKDATFKENEYKVKDIVTYTFNEGTVLEGSEELQAEIMNNGKNPGLGIRGLHKEGITGMGVNVAIIDQNLLLHHPEFDGKIVKYFDTGCEMDEKQGSMHAPAVTSILVGDTIGVAPDAKVYFAAVPSWNGDSEYYAKALYWIIEENKNLSEGEKIRVVSVSAAPSGEGTPFTKNIDMWDEAVLAAQKEGILVLDCRTDSKTGIICPAFYNIEHPDDVSLCSGGFPTSKFVVESSNIGVPTSYRTVAEEYIEGNASYQYTGQGGLSWGIPYAAGVLALGWQVDPTLDNDQMIQILFDTCSKSNDGSNIINPVAFIDAIRKEKE